MLIFCANYINFMGFQIILRNLPGAAGRRLKKRTQWYFVGMNCLYALTLLLAFVPRFGPTCTADKMYPPVMNWTSCLFIVNYIFHLVINCNKGYYLEYQDNEAELIEWVNSANAQSKQEKTDETSQKIGRRLSWDTP